MSQTEHIADPIPWAVELCRRALVDLADYGDRESEEDASWSIHRLRVAMDGNAPEPEWDPKVLAALRRCR